MKQYMSPKAEIVVFQDEMIIAESGCDCSYDIENHNLQIEGTQVGCKAETGGAAENPFQIIAPQWTFG